MFTAMSNIIRKIYLKELHSNYCVRFLPSPEGNLLKLYDFSFSLLSGSEGVRVILSKHEMTLRLWTCWFIYNSTGKPYSKFLGLPQSLKVSAEWLPSNTTRVRGLTSLQINHPHVYCLLGYDASWHDEHISTFQMNLCFHFQDRNWGYLFLLQSWR